MLLVVRAPPRDLDVAVVSVVVEICYRGPVHSERCGIRRTGILGKEEGGRKRGKGRRITEGGRKKEQGRKNKGTRNKVLFFVLFVLRSVCGCVRIVWYLIYLHSERLARHTHIVGEGGRRKEEGRRNEALLLVFYFVRRDKVVSFSLFVLRSVSAFRIVWHQISLHSGRAHLRWW